LYRDPVGTGEIKSKTAEMKTEDKNTANYRYDAGYRVSTGYRVSISEAKVYLALVLKNPMSGYEIAKNSDITRAMVYDILKRLMQKGAVIEIESNTKLYSPVPYKELLKNTRMII